MSEIRVTNIIGETGVDAVTFTKGINATGIVTATSFSWQWCKFNRYLDTNT